jgi:hypothetical protein
MARRKKEVANLSMFFAKQEDKDERPKKKYRKIRKPMSEEQRLAAAERLKKAREKRMKENPPKYKHVHPSVLRRSDEDPLNFMNIKDWITVNKLKLKDAKANERKNVKGASLLVSKISGYISIMENFLKTGDWYGMYCGENEDQLVKTHCVALAYYSNGYPKRTVGVFYPDMGETWTREMDTDYRENILKM